MGVNTLIVLHTGAEAANLMGKQYSPIILPNIPFTAFPTAPSRNAIQVVIVILLARFSLQITCSY
jgi:hypothetical protein